MANLRKIARDAAIRHHIDPTLFERQIGAESGFRARVCSGAGACGVAQLMPGTAASLGVDPNDPVAALNGAARLMSGYVQKYGSYENALRAYNAGPAAIKASHSYAETNAYVAKIMGGQTGTKAAAKRGSTRSVRTKIDPGTDAVVTPAREVPDAHAAALAALVGRVTDPAKKLPGLGGPSLLSSAVENLQSGAYTKTEPTKVQMGRDASVSTTAAPTSAVARKTGRLEPAGSGAKVIGTPHSGTHTLGNWQSDNAVDIAVPEGTPLVALQDGVVVKVKHHPQDGGRFAGDQITVRGANGNMYFYAHGKSTNVKRGQRIRRGQVIGKSGSANGVQHLHFGQERGDPREHTG